MKLDDYEEFDDEKPDEEPDEETDGKNGSKNSRITWVSMIIVFLAVCILMGGAVLYSFKRDDKDAVNTELSASGLQAQEMNAEKLPGNTMTGTSRESESIQDSQNEEKSQEQIMTDFLPDNSKVTAKEVVNLRSLPSTTDEACVILGTLSNGEVLQRTGISYEMGWSKLEYNGQTVYAVTSYLEVVN